MKETLSKAGEEILGYCRGLRESWVSDDTWKLIDERKRLHQKHHKSVNSDSTYRSYVSKDKEVKRSLQKDKRNG